MCGNIGHFKVKCPRTRQCGGDGSGSRGDKGGRGNDGGRRNTGSRGRHGLGRGRSQETNLVSDGNQSEEPTRPVQLSPEFAFTVEQVTGHEQKSSDLITLIVGGVAVSDVLIDSGATCNVVGQHTWEMLKLKGIKCELHKLARQLFAYGAEGYWVVKSRKFSISFTLVPSKRTMWTVEELRVVSGCFEGIRA